MNPNHDEAKLTAYALGELAAADRAEVERWIEEDDEARRFVNEVRALGGMLKEQLSASERQELLPIQRSRIAQHAHGERERRLRRRSWVLGFASAMAASIAIAGGLWVANRPTGGKPTVARNDLTPPTKTADPTPGQVFSLAPPLSVLLDDPASKASYARLGNVEPLGAGLKVSGNRSDFGVAGRASADGTAISEPKIPYRDIMLYPENWPDISDLRGRAVVANGDVNEVHEVRDLLIAPPAFVRPPDFGLQANGQGGANRSGRGGNWRGVLNDLDGDGDLDLGGRIALNGGALALGRQLEDRERNKAVAEARVLEAEAKFNPADFAGFEAELHPDHNTEAYSHIADNPFLRPTDNPLSTFSIDVDTASYSNMRRFLAAGQLPPKDAVRIEELLNYFPYSDAPPPDGGDPFAAHIEVAGCPWAPDHRLARVALKAHTVDDSKRPPANLVFLIDVSGSMNTANKLPLVQQSLRQLLAKLKNTDKVSIVVYAGSSGVVLPPTACGENMGTILGALDNLQAGGSTNGGQGIELAYRLASETFIKGGINRVILATDGDFNVGVTNQGDLTRLIETKAKSGVYLSVLGFGMGNVKDSTMETLADKGNGNYAYIDSLAEARKVLVEQSGGTLITVAKDVKIQVEFNPAKVSSYRLIGYENRMLKKEDFNDDAKDAGEIGSGHSVVALYELVPAGAPADKAAPAVDELRYQKVIGPAVNPDVNELMTVKLRYKAPDGEVSKKLEFPVAGADRPIANASEDLRFSAAVAQFGMLLRESPHKGAATFQTTLELAQQGIGPDTAGHRREFVELVKKAGTMKR